MATAVPDELITHTRAERERLADLLEGLTPAQWDTASLCAGWRVREVAAHLTMPFRTKPLSVMAGIVAAGFSFNRYADRDARAVAKSMGEQDLVNLLRANITHPWSPPGGGAAGALSHDVIHGLDITEPLGLPAPPPERIAAVLSSTTERQIRYFGVDLGERVLVANDADVTVGQGPSRVELPARDILLIITGRRDLDRVVHG